MVLYERKRGEFGDGIHNGYIQQDKVIERNLFFRIYYAANGDINKSTEKKLFLRQTFTEDSLQDTEKLDNFYFGYLCFKKLFKAKNAYQKVEKNIYGQVYAMTRKYKPDEISDYRSSVESNFSAFKKEWSEFVRMASLIKKSLYRTYVDNESQKPVSFFSESKWYKSSVFEQDVLNYFLHKKNIEDVKNYTTEETKQLTSLTKSVLLETGLSLKDRVQLNLQKNTKQLRIAEFRLMKLKEQHKEISEKISSATSDGSKYTLSRLLKELDGKIQEVRQTVDNHKKWIQEDSERLVGIIEKVP